MSSKSAAGRRRIRAVAPPVSGYTPRDGRETSSRKRDGPVPGEIHLLTGSLQSDMYSRGSVSPSSQFSGSSHSPSGPTTYHAYPASPLSELEGLTSIRKLSVTSSQTRTQISTPQSSYSSVPMSPVSPTQTVFYPPGRSSFRPGTSSPNKFRIKAKKPQQGETSSPKRNPGRFRTLLRWGKQKKQSGGLITPLSVPGVTPPSQPHHSGSPPLLPSSFQTQTDWLRRNDCKVHPYQDIPYPLTYDEPVLESDRCSDILLRRLSSGSPFFCDTGTRAPRTVLDLGCGQGHWVLDTARLWKAEGTFVVGFDMVDLTEGVWPPESSRENYRLTRGNFLQRLPFPDESFDLIRMANLALCIPYNQWHTVLTEVKRVLSYGGRLELIDDEIMFAYGQNSFPTHGSSSSAPNISILIPSPSFTLQSTVSSDSLLPYLTPPNHSPDPDYQGPSYRYATPALGTSLVSHRARSPESDFDRSTAVRSEWNEQISASQDLETLFEHMLAQQRGLYLRPSDFFLEALTNVFGKRRATVLKSMHLKLAPSELHPTSGSFSTTCPGLILWPSTFIPIPQEELRMHTLRCPSILLGCKPALAEYVEVNEDGLRVVDEEFWDALCNYETFLEHRFDQVGFEVENSLKPTTTGNPRRNSVTSEMSCDMHQYQSMFQDSLRWEQNSDHDSIEERSSTPVPIQRGFNTNISPKSSIYDDVPAYTREEQPHIRTLRVYEAIKCKS